MLTTVQAKGIAAFHTSFMRENQPYHTQIPQEKHEWNTHVKVYMLRYTRKYMQIRKIGCKT